MTDTFLSFDQASRRIRAALAARQPRSVALEGYRRAAVLVPLLRRAEGATVLLTRRTERLRQHRGEIAFPGGHVEAGEAPGAAALREAREEVALEPDRVEIAGQLDDRPSVTGFIVTPVVGLVADPPSTFRAEEREVHEVFEVPLARFVGPDAARCEWWDASRLPPGTPVRPLADLAADEVDAAARRYRVWFFDVAADRIVWGLTARVVKELVERAFP